MFCHTPHGATRPTRAAPRARAAVEPAHAGRQHLHAVHLGVARRQRHPGPARPARRQLEAVPVVPRRHAGASATSTCSTAARTQTIADDRHRRRRHDAAGRRRDDAASRATWASTCATTTRSRSPTTARWPRATANCALVDANQRFPAGSGRVIGVRAPGVKPLLPLEPTGSGGRRAGAVRDLPRPAPLRDRSGQGQPEVPARAALPGGRAERGRHNAADDIICLSCHDKNLASGAWALLGACQPAGGRRDLHAPRPPRSASSRRRCRCGGASCLNCHDTHTVQGARRLTREGTDTHCRWQPAEAGRRPALEQTCYQCHTNAAQVGAEQHDAGAQHRDRVRARRAACRSPRSSRAAAPRCTTSAATSTTSASSTARLRTTGAAPTSIEPRSAAGAQRHAECTDCHNPHRVVKFRNRLFTGRRRRRRTPAGHAPARRGRPATRHTNIASRRAARHLGRGADLRLAVVPEPCRRLHRQARRPGRQRRRRGRRALRDARVPDLPEVPLELRLRRQQRLSDRHAAAARQHRRHAAGHQQPDAVTPTRRRSSRRRSAHRGEATTTDSGAGSNYSTNNHRSWHPVMDADRPHARDPQHRRSTARWRPPWRNAVGTQTMYCSDCHGANATSATSVIPQRRRERQALGAARLGQQLPPEGRLEQQRSAPTLCFKCHDQQVYSPTRRHAQGRHRTPASAARAASRPALVPLRTRSARTLKCNWCHVAVPHGWKNKALLVNLNDVGPEAGPRRQRRVAHERDRAGLQPGAVLPERQAQGAHLRDQRQLDRTNCGSNKLRHHLRHQRQQHCHRQRLDEGRMHATRRDVPRDAAAALGRARCA